ALSYIIRYKPVTQKSYSSITVTDANHILTNLLSDSRYVWYIISVCESGLHSSISSLSYFNTTSVVENNFVQQFGEQSPFLISHRDEELFLSFEDEEIDKSTMVVYDMYGRLLASVDNSENTSLAPMIPLIETI